MPYPVESSTKSYIRQLVCSSGISLSLTWRTVVARRPLPTRNNCVCTKQAKIINKTWILQLQTNIQLFHLIKHFIILLLFRKIVLPHDVNATGWSLGCCCLSKSFLQVNSNSSHYFSADKDIGNAILFSKNRQVRYDINWRDVRSENENSSNDEDNINPIPLLILANGLHHFLYSTTCDFHFWSYNKRLGSRKRKSRWLTLFHQFQNFLLQRPISQRFCNRAHKSGLYVLLAAGFWFSIRHGCRNSTKPR